MTKEELLLTEHTVEAANGNTSYVPLMTLNKFLDSNFCIPKGTNRHSYADILHQWIEGAECQIRYGKEFSWIPMHIVPPTTEYRIKPQEPVYEWQWVCKATYDSDYFVPNGWHTFEELQPQVNQLSRIEETKRIRK